MPTNQLPSLPVPAVFTVNEDARALQQRIWSKMNADKGLSYLEAYKQCVSEDAQQQHAGQMPPATSVAAAAAQGRASPPSAARFFEARQNAGASFIVPEGFATRPEAMDLHRRAAAMVSKTPGLTYLQAVRACEREDAAAAFARAGQAVQPSVPVPVPPQAMSAVPPGFTARPETLDLHLRASQLQASLPGMSYLEAVRRCMREAELKEAQPGGQAVLPGELVPVPPQAMSAMPSGFTARPEMLDLHLRASRLQNKSPGMSYLDAARRCMLETEAEEAKPRGRAAAPSTAQTPAPPSAPRSTPVQAALPAPGSTPVQAAPPAPPTPAAQVAAPLVDLAKPAAASAPVANGFIGASRLKEAASKLRMHLQCKCITPASALSQLQGLEQEYRRLDALRRQTPYVSKAQGYAMLDADKDIWHLNQELRRAKAS